MNVFTTDHPIVSQPSCFDARIYPLASFVWTSLVIALLLLPVLIAFDLYTTFDDATEIGADYDLPDSWTGFIAGTFVFCLLCSVLLVSVYRVLGWHFRKAYRRVDE